MTTQQEPDAVDRIVAQWARERPELDTGPMSLIGRLHRVAGLLDAALRPPFAEEGIGNGDFDVLASLRRAGAPYRLTPSELTATMMVTSGAVSKRIDRLEAMGLVSRSVAEHDGRSRLVALTPAGLEVVERVVAKHWANEERLLAPLSAEERAAMVAGLRKLLANLEG